jgi:hypothetical protein
LYLMLNIETTNREFSADFFSFNNVFISEMLFHYSFAHFYTFPTFHRMHLYYLTYTSNDTSHASKGTLLCVINHVKWVWNLLTFYANLYVLNINKILSSLMKRIPHSLSSNLVFLVFLFLSLSPN